MLFKILHGDKARISTDITPYHEGYCYVTYDGDFYVDMNNERVKLNAKDCETLMGISLDELKNEIATQDAVILAEAQAYTDEAISNIEMPELSNLETESKDIVGAINEVNGKTVDRIGYIDTYYGSEAIDLAVDEGITWQESFQIYGDSVYREGEIYHRVPIVAGNNVTFEVDQGVVKINATGGSGGGGSGEGITVDEELSMESTNPVQNKVVKAELDEKLSQNGGRVKGDLDVEGADGLGGSVDASTVWVETIRVSARNSNTEIMVEDDVYFADGTGGYVSSYELIAALRDANIL